MHGESVHDYTRLRRNQFSVKFNFIEAFHILQFLLIVYGVFFASDYYVLGRGVGWGGVGGYSVLSVILGSARYTGHNLSYLG